MKDPETFCKLTATNFRPRTPAEVYSCGLVNHGWAYMFIHEETGTVAIHSDYGDWVFSWPAPGRGPGTLKEFICYAGSGSFDYMARKFTMGMKEQFNKDETIRVIQNKLAEASDEKPITWHDDVCREINDWLEDEAPDSGEMFYERMPKEIHELLGDAAYEEFVYEMPPEFFWLRDGVLPALITELRKTMPRTEVPA